MSAPRPTARLPQIRQAAAEKMTDALIADGHVEADARDDAIADLVEHALDHFDGYELAKALDHGAMWDCNFAMAQTLDGWGVFIREAVQAAEQEWAKTADLMPPYPVGTRVSFGWRGETGMLDGIDQHGVGRYLIKVDGQEDTPKSRSRRLENFEDVRPLARATSPSPGRADGERP